VKVTGYTICTTIAGLNLYLLYRTIGAGWLGLLAAVAVAFWAWVRFFYRGP
jgi:manganese transport protein